MTRWVQKANGTHPSFPSPAAKALELSEREELELLRKENVRLRMEREIQKKSGGLLRGGERVRYTFIAAQKAEFPVSVLCSVLDASRSGYYAWCARPQAAREQQDAILAETITEVHDQSRGTYGSPRVHAELKQRGVQVGKKRVARLMRDRGLAARRKRRFRRTTTESQHPYPIAANLLARSFSRSAPNQAWVGDITYIRTDEGWLYLAVLLDLFSRRVVGWVMS